MDEPERRADGCTILLVKDDAAIRPVVSQLLRDEGYTVIEAADGADAIGVLDRTDELGPIALVVLDMNLPRVGGLGVLEHVASQPNRRDGRTSNGNRGECGRHDGR